MCDSKDRSAPDQAPHGCETDRGTDEDDRPGIDRKSGSNEDLSDADGDSGESVPNRFVLEVDSDRTDGSDGSPATARFLVDSTAGKLVRWLRLLGFDSAYADSAADYRLVHRARAEKRILLTRRRSVCFLPWAEAVLLESDQVTEQLVQVARRFTLPENPLSRCSLCNSLLDEVSKETVKQEVPPFVYKTASGFSRCTGCGHVYWEGTHCSRIMGLWRDLRELARRD
jgi:uncharacterized protein with PIN domain